MAAGEPVEDPNRPGYRPGIDPSDSRELGSGKGFGADLFALYRAGRVYFPERAILFSEWTSATHDFAQRIDYLNSSVGHEYALTVTEELRTDLHFALRQTAVAMRDVGTAMVAISTDYATTDQAAREEFVRLVDKNPHLFEHPTPHVPPPPGSEDPYDTPYDGPSLEAPEPEPWWPVSWLGDQVDGVVDDLLDGIGDFGDALVDRRETDG
jgi:hypothetical protein